MEPNYGDSTVCRPLVENVPMAGEAGWVETICPYCGKPCWRTNLEECLPADGSWTAACTACALKRGHHQREMDRARAEREAKL